MASSLLLKKVSARVFTSPISGAGGNPVTVFMSKAPLEEANRIVQARWAQECEWESVVCSTSQVLPQLAFFMPSGEQVSYCAHAAMGALHSYVRSDETRSASKHSVSFETAALSSSKQIATVDQDDTVGLHMHSTFTQNSIGDDKAKLENMLNMLQLDINNVSNKWPSLSNSSVFEGRDKLLLGIKSLEALQAAQPPSDPEQWRSVCDYYKTTGLYLYTPRGVEDETTTYEVRQFPRASGYPEDPATGVAAAALAVGLHKQCVTDTFFSFHQGRAMGRPSLIKIQDVEMDFNSQKTKFSIWGSVEIDDEQVITLSY